MRWHGGLGLGYWVGLGFWDGWEWDNGFGFSGWVCSCQLGFPCFLVGLSVGVCLFVCLFGLIWFWFFCLVMYGGLWLGFPDGKKGNGCDTHTCHCCHRPQD